MSGFFGDDDLLEYAYEKEERAAIQIHDGGLSESEALAAQQSSTSCDSTSTSNEDDDRTNMTHFSRHNCSGIIAFPETASVAAANGNKLQQSNLPAHVRDDVVKADGCDIGTHGNEATNATGEKLPESGKEAKEDWSCLSADDRIARARGDLLTDNVAATMRAHYQVSDSLSRTLAVGFITLCRNLTIDSPLQLLEELSLKWSMRNAGGSPYVAPGEWLFKEAHYYAKYAAPREAQRVAEVEAKKPVVNWAVIRQNIINCAKPGGNSMRGADLSDYVSHMRATNTPIDREASIALRALEAAGLIERRNGGVSVRTEMVAMPEKKKEKIDTKKALDHLREVVERCYGVDRDWMAVVDDCFPMMKSIWRGSQSGDLIMGIADQIERDKK
jgi:hypothetical protein